MGGLGLMFRRRAIQAHPTAGSSIALYDWLVGNKDGYIDLPIFAKMGWTYIFNFERDEAHLTAQSSGYLCSGNFEIYHSTYSEARIDIIPGGEWVWNSFGGATSFAFMPDGVYRNGSKLTSHTLSANGDRTFRIFASSSSSGKMGAWMKLKNLEVFDETGKAVHLFLPCQIDGIVGLYDVIGQLFAPNIYENEQLGLIKDEQ